MATLSTYRTMVQNEVGDVSARAQNVIDRALQDTYQVILLHTAKYLINPVEEDVTASTANRFVTPTNTYTEFQHILYKAVGDDNFRELKPIKEETYYSHWVNSDAAEPTGYYLKGNVVYFNTTPTTAGTVRISGLEAQDELSGSTVSVIPDRFTRVLVLGAIGRFKSYEGTPDASEYLKQFKGSFWGQGRIDGALGEMLMELSTKRRVIKPTFYGR